MTTTGAPLNLTLYASGQTNWDFDPNFETLNTTIGTIQGQITALQAASSTVGPTGPVGIVYAGAWNSATAYTISPSKQVVYYNGSSYVAIAPNTNQRPDLFPNTWNPLSLMGAAGPQGTTGPQGTPGTGGGTNIALPVSLLDGGTGVAAANAAAARAGLAAAASGVNADITMLSALAPTPGLSNPAAINISSNGDAQGIILTDGNVNGGITTSCDAFFNSLSMQGNLVCGNALISGLLSIGQIGNNTPGVPLLISLGGGGGIALEIAGGLQIDGATPTVGSGKLGLGTTTSSTATAGGGAGIPSTVATFWVVNVGGVTYKVPLLAA